jgi:hypothetical protein
MWEDRSEASIPSITVTMLSLSLLITAALNIVNGWPYIVSHDYEIAIPACTAATVMG